ncbi:hypothetical protein [Myxococcus sp. RHSTA-1-4]|uniref:hypothetical protein n=1 Tax=Myxococcus sp. RHSTA-1-4 TaxID=2874601 RepID=UPI001CBC8304|nr:hypothetical protein [Myxococcus sp. RHSTA-1-4]
MSQALRIFTLALLLGWQAVAAGAGGPAHFCQKQVETRSAECHCPHGEMKAEKAPHGQPALRMDCCEEPGWEMPPPAFADVSSHSHLVAPPPALLPRWLSIRPPEGGRLPMLARWETPPAQGPPVFLRIRSLLI